MNTHGKETEVYEPARYTESMASWPQHEERHRRTMLGARLYDPECLRCHLETVAAEAAAVKKT